jgi:hypothetical protein
MSKYFIMVNIVFDIKCKQSLHLVIKMHCYMITFVIIEAIVFNDRLVTHTKKFCIHYINWKPLNTPTLIRH